VEELDLSPYYVSIIASAVAALALLVAILPHLPHRMENQPMTNGDLLNEVKKHFQDLEAKLQTGGTTESVLDEIKAMRQDLEAKYEKRDTNSVLDEVRKLRAEFESRFGTKFSNQGFTADDAYPFFLAISNSLNRFGREKEIGLGSNPITEAKGYVGILRLILSWAQANGEDGIKIKAEEFLEAAQRTLEKASHL
jgi:hypothetical protein